jgi:4-carboxymuconolactone decarboxylase
MRLTAPRIAPLPQSEWNEDAREIVPRAGTASGPPLNIFTTLARHPKLLKRWLVFGSHVLAKSTLPPRERELAILRTGWLCRCRYEFHQHMRIGKSTGLSDDEIRRIAEPAETWTGRDAALLRACDELHADQMIGDATWAALREGFGEQQVMDLIFAVGQYTLVSMFLNSAGVQIEGGVDHVPW